DSPPIEASPKSGGRFWQCWDWLAILLAMSDVTRILSQIEQGDPCTRIVGGKETMNYWDLEAARFALEHGLPWLRINADTGLLSSVPNRSAKVDVVVITTIDREV